MQSVGLLHARVQRFGPPTTSALHRSGEEQSASATQGSSSWLPTAPLLELDEEEVLLVASLDEAASLGAPPPAELLVLAPPPSPPPTG
jgi:hypothetical protein